MVINIRENSNAPKASTHTKLHMDPRESKERGENFNAPKALSHLALYTHHSKNTARTPGFNTHMLHMHPMECEK